jgi:hypothetical protein
MAQDFAASVQAVGLRVCKLTSAGVPVVGATSCYTTKAFTRFSWTPEYEEGEEISTVAADGTICVYFKMDDTIKQVTMELEICKPQPEIHEILAGGTLLTEATENVGWAMPDVGSVATPNGVSVEVWSRAIVNGRPAATNPFWRWVLPYVKTRLEGDRTLENGALANVFSGTGLGNSSWGDGPGGDWTFPTTAAMSYARDDTAVTAEGYFTVAA